MDRTRGKRGYCRAPLNPVVYSYMAHRGEEPPISGTRGSGTIFFSHCTMKCVYCQNYSFSQLDQGNEITIEKLSGIMLHLQDIRCHNINLVSPTHFIPQIAAAFDIARSKGLDIPLVYNTSGYDSTEILRLISGMVDIYMPDMRYSDDRAASKYSDAPDYVKFNRLSVREMQSQAGDLVIDENGIARKGVIIRLLALPGGISGTEETLKFIRSDISKNAYLSIMSQYYPTFRAFEYKPLARGVTRPEYQNVVDEALRLGLNKGWVQDMPAEPDEKFLGTNIKPRK